MTVKDTGVRGVMCRLDEQDILPARRCPICEAPMFPWEDLYCFECEEQIKIIEEDFKVW